jgi:DNA-binding transcriptional ArsR family regulator
MIGVLKAMAEPRRLAILELVQEQEMLAGEIAKHFEVTRTAISQHISVLVDAGLLRVRREGTKRIYCARAEGLKELKEFVEGFWNSSLDNLQQMLESEDDEDESNQKDN